MKLTGLAKFSQLDNADACVQSALRQNRWLVVMHGDDGLFWVVTGRQARKLEAAGYERAMGY